MEFFKEEDYFISKNGTVERITLEKVAGKDKNTLLRECLTFYCDMKKHELLPSLGEFECNGIITGENEEVCCCSQDIKKRCYISHIPSKRKFKIGKNCMERLFQDDFVGEYVNFFKPNCKWSIYCNNKVENRKSAYGKVGFCSVKCMNTYNKYPPRDGQKGRSENPCEGCGKLWWCYDPTHKYCHKCYIDSFHKFREQ